jgi:phosphopantothenoylcysteine synthetase/decarboxylase
MEAIKADKVRSVFYKGNTNRPNWESFKTIEQIARKVTGKNLPSKKTAKPEREYILHLVRSHIYALMDQELTQQGRFIVAVKRPREQVVYGFTRERDKIINYIARRKKRDLNIANHTNEINEMANTLMRFIKEEKIDHSSIEEEMRRIKIEYSSKEEEAV